MFGWFAPRCPLDTREKTWVEWRMLWLADRFGIDRMRTAEVVLPTSEYFPDEFRGDEASARTCLDRVCGYMGVDPASVELEILADEQMPGAAGLYHQQARSVVSVARSQLAAPPQLLATLVHEVAHELLLKGGHLSRESADHEQVTDLLPVFLGTGIFLANATVQSSSGSDGTTHFWSISRQGYLSSITLGYALALFAFVRGEARPPWAVHLRTDAAATLRAGLRFLHRTGDSLFRPDCVGLPKGAPTPGDMAARLGHPSPTARLAALWDVTRYALPATELLPAVERCLRDRDPDVRCEAVHTLGTFGATAAATVPRLIEATWYGEPGIRSAAATALGEIGGDPGEVVPALAAVLADEQPDVICAAAGALARYGRDAQPAEPRLLAAIETAASVTDYGRLASLVAALQAISPDPRAGLRSYFVDRDPEVLRLALGVLRDQGR